MCLYIVGGGVVLAYNDCKIWNNNICFTKLLRRLGVVAQASNPSYLGGRDQENCSSRPVLAKSS
jgi:hypothetical protein